MREYKTPSESSKLCNSKVSGFYYVVFKYVLYHVVDGFNRRINKKVKNNRDARGNVRVRWISRRERNTRVFCVIAFPTTQEHNDT